MSEWISIEDQIPDEHEPVIISGWNFNNEEKGRYVEPAVRVGMDFWPPFERDEGLVKILIMEGRPFFPPTHWMPLPAAPGETAQPAAEQPDTAHKKLNELDIALKFALCNFDHDGTRRDVKKAQTLLEELRALLGKEGE